MILPARVIHLEKTASTQDDAVAAGFGIFWTANQTQGKGRYDRQWFSKPGEALAMSICFEVYRNHPKPYLLGMAVAIAVAEELDLLVQWPNDLVLNGKKIAGILTEVHNGLIVVGIGLNLATTEFPEDIQHRATSLAIEGRVVPTPESAMLRLTQAIEAFEPAPLEWSDVKSRWHKRDQTAGKNFKHTDGRLGRAICVDDTGALTWSDGKEELTLSVGEALWGL